MGIAGGIVLGGTLNITNGNPSTSAITGAFIVGGGVGVNGNLYVATGQVFITNSNASSSTSTGVLVVSGGVGVGGNINAGGQITAASFNASSDYRIKTNVLDLTNEFSVDNLFPKVYFNELTQQKDIGFIAHEVQQYYPYLVCGEKDGTNYQSLNYQGIIPILVNEIKMLKKQLSLINNCVQ